MSLNLKNPETERLARELAQKKGENLTAAVTLAIKERLERHDRSPRDEGQLERLIEIVNRTASRMKDSRPSQELFDELYDEAGLPK
ncbi:MAG: type II toxin-antitoxin system VapB family antitoxin [Terracidiphilus sp.]